MADVFISYSQLAPEPTQELAADLTAKRYAVWFDSRLLPGDSFWQVIEDKIRNAKAVIVLWSKPALQSKGVRSEAQLADDLGKLVCVRTPEVQSKDIGLPFNRLEQTLISDRQKIYAKLAEMGVRPEGGTAPRLPAGERDAGEAAMAWQHISGETDAELVEEFLRHYGGGHPFYRRLAEKRLLVLRPPKALVPVAAPARPAPNPPPATTAADVLLRLDPGMHTATIKRIAVTADGRTLATASDDKTVRLWSLPDGALIRTLRPAIGDGDDGKVYAVALDPTGRWVAAGGWETSSQKQSGHFVAIFDAATGAIATRLGPLPNVVSDLCVSPDGTRLAAGLGGSRGIRVWSTGDWRPAFEDTEYGGSVCGLAFATDGRLAATSLDGHVRLSSPTGRRLAMVKAPGGEQPFGIAISSDGTKIAVGYDDSTRVDVLDGQSLAPLWQADTNGVSSGDLSSVAWLDGGARLAAAGRHSANGLRPILVWADGGRGSRTAWAGPGNTVMDLAPLPGGGLAFGAAGPAFGVRDATGRPLLDRGSPLADLRSKRFEHFLVAPDGRRVRFGLDPGGGTPMLLDLAAATLVPSPQAPAGLAQADTTSIKVEGWENKTRPTLDGKPLSLEQYETARSLAILPATAGFILGTEWWLRRFDRAGKETWPRPVPGIVWGVNTARDGRLVVAAYGDGTLRWHRADTGDELLAVFVHVSRDSGTPKPLGWVAWTPKGHYTCSPGADHLIGWHVNRGLDQAADFYPAETFAATFRRPDLVAAALDGV